MSNDQTDRDRRRFLASSSVVGATGALWSALPFAAAVGLSPTHSINSKGSAMSADLILFNGRLHAEQLLPAALTQLRFARQHRVQVKSGRRQQVVDPVRDVAPQPRRGVVVGRI